MTTPSALGLGESSAVVRVNETTRTGLLLSLLPTTTQNPRTLASNFRINVDATTFLAVQHFNSRQSLLVPTLQERLKACDLFFSIEMRDTQFDPIAASRQYQEAVLSPMPPTAIVGAVASAVSTEVAILAGTQAIPQVSPASTTSLLDNKDQFPFFARTIPSNLGDSNAACIFLKSLGVNQLGVLYVINAYGVPFLTDMMAAAQASGIRIISAGFYDGVEGSLDAALEQLRAQEVTYFFGILGSATFLQTIGTIHSNGMIGVPEKNWLFSDTAAASITGNIPTQLAKALNGTGAIVIRSLDDKNATLQKQLDEFASNSFMMTEYLNAHVEREVFPPRFQFQPASSSSALLAYDAMMAIGIAACEAQSDNFTGQELYNALLSTQFDGASGHVAFSAETGTRKLDTVSYRVVNVLADPPNPDSNLTFSIGVDAAYVNLGDKTVDVIRPFRFADGTTNAPASSRMAGEELNLISRGVLYFTVSVAVLVMFLSVGCAWWTIRNREKRVVRRSQPIFLCMLCVGTFVMASTVGFQAFQEPFSQRALDFACMISPWLVSVGFTTTFAALFSKTWRINHVYKKAQKFKRVKVTVRDVLLPFAALCAVSVAVLTAWSVTDPLKWKRITISEDAYGQPTASYGTCYALERKGRGFLVTSIALCMVALVIANYQSFKARKLPTDYNEAFFVAITNAILLESAIVGASIIAIVREDPEAFFLVRSLLLIVASLSVLLPIFVPKMLHKEGKKRRRGVYLRALSFDTLSSGSGGF